MRSQSTLLVGISSDIVVCSMGDRNRATLCCSLVAPACLVETLVESLFSKF